mgnify:CR=1 FL=1
MNEKNNEHYLRKDEKNPEPVPEKPQRIRPKLTGVLSRERFLAYWKAKGVE